MTASKKETEPMTQPSRSTQTKLTQACRGIQQGLRHHPELLEIYEPVTRIRELNQPDTDQ